MNDTWTQKGWRRVAGAVGAMVVAAACVPAPDPAVPSGPVTANQVLVVELSGAYQHRVEGQVLGGDLAIRRDDGGAVVAISGTASVPGRGAQRARVAFDLEVVFGRAVGSIDLVDPAAGVAVTTQMVGAPLLVAEGRIEGSASWVRAVRAVELVPYELEWSLRDGTLAPSPIDDVPQASSGSFNVVTYNVAGLPEPISGSRPVTFSPLISPLLNAYDVVLLQEDFFYQPEVASALTHAYGSEPERQPWGSDPTRPDAIVGSGLERYSRLPFTDHVQVRWPGCFGGLIGPGAADCASQKGFSVARQYVADGISIDVYNLHGEAGSTAEDEYWSEEGYRALAAYITQNSAGRPLIVAGDFNLSPLNPTDAVRLARLQSATGLIDVCEVQDCSVDPGTIDRIMFRSSSDLILSPTAWSIPRARFSLPDGTPLSDHDPTDARFEWRVEGAA